MVSGKSSPDSWTQKGDNDYLNHPPNRPFRESLHMIPTPVKLKRQTPLSSNLAVVIATPIFLLGLGIALEIGLKISLKNSGFSVPRQNVISFVSAQFLLAFVPTCLVIPLAWVWRELDWTIRYYHPWVLLSNGFAKAEESILLDYVALGPFFSLFQASHYKHRIVFWSSFAAMLTYILQPLASSIFQIRQLSETTAGTATSIRAIGLAPNISQLDPFLAAAGFAEAASFYNLSNPPFINGGWATADFVFPNDYELNGTMAVNTTGIQTTLTCDNGVGTSVRQLAANNITVESTSLQKCAVTVNIDLTSSTQQFGVRDAYCNDPPGLDIEFRPLMFWYLLQGANGTLPKAKAIFCSASLAALSVEATADLTTGGLLSVDIHGPFDGDSNVTKGDMAGKAFNGLLFTPSPNPYIQARATAIYSALPSAVYRLAAASDGGLQGAFNSPNTFLDLTSTTYRQYLAVSAKAIYFVPTDVQLPARMTALAPHLWIDPLPAHTLAIVLILSGCIGLFVHLFNHRHRRNLYLSKEFNSIAAIAATTARSGFGELLRPYDDLKTMERKLRGYRFTIDRRTGAIVAEWDPNEEEGVLGKRNLGRREGKEEAMMSLLGNVQPSGVANSSHTALTAAIGYQPWKLRPTSTLYDP